MAGVRLKVCDRQRKGIRRNDAARDPEQKEVPVRTPQDKVGGSTETGVLSGRD